MNKKLLKNAIIMATMVLFVPLMATAQVTIGSTDVPRATLDVRSTGTTSAQGVIPPHVPIATLNATENLYTLQQRGAVIFVSDTIRTTIVTPHSIIRYIDAPGHYYFCYGRGSDTGGAHRAWRPLGAGGAGGGEIQVIVADAAALEVIAPANNTLVFVSANNVQLEFPTRQQHAINGSIITVIVDPSVTTGAEIMQNGASITDSGVNSIMFEQTNDWTWFPTNIVASNKRAVYMFVSELGNVGKWIVVSGM